MVENDATRDQYVTLQINAKANEFLYQINFFAEKTFVYDLNSIVVQDVDFSAAQNSLRTTFYSEQFIIHCDLFVQT